MGIQGLLKRLGPLLVPPPVSSHEALENLRGNATGDPPKHNIRQFADRTLAIDASSWLHKAGYSTAEGLVESIESGIRDPVCERVYTRYMLRRCDELLNHAHVRAVILVFDGKRCPLKAGTNAEREERRKANLVEARRLKRLGRHSEAGEKYKLCVRTTEEMARTVAKAVADRWGRGRTARVWSVFSPYEADAQLAKLCVDGLADAIVTEDSDVLVYSAACDVPFPVIFKLDRASGSCDVITMDWLLRPKSLQRQCPGAADKDEQSGERQSDMASMRRILSPPAKEKKKSSGTGGLVSTLRTMVARESRQPGSGARMFVQACVLSGCDYAPSQLVGVGLVTAFKLVTENSSRDPARRFHHVLKSLPHGKVVAACRNGKNDSENLAVSRNGSNNKNRVSEKERIAEYERLLAKSEAVFYYHLVRDESHSEVVSLVTPPQQDRDKNRNSQKESIERGVSTDKGTGLILDPDQNKLSSVRQSISKNDFLPTTERFDGDLSFVGSAVTSSNALSFLGGMGECGQPSSGMLGVTKRKGATLAKLFSDSSCSTRQSDPQQSSMSSDNIIESIVNNVRGTTAGKHFSEGKSSAEGKSTEQRTKSREGCIDLFSRFAFRVAESYSGNDDVTTNKSCQSAKSDARLSGSRIQSANPSHAKQQPPLTNACYENNSTTNARQVTLDDGDACPTKYENEAKRLVSGHALPAKRKAPEVGMEATSKLHVGSSLRFPSTGGNERKSLSHSPSTAKRRKKMPEVRGISSRFFSAASTSHKEKAHENDMSAIHTASGGSLSSNDRIAQIEDEEELPEPAFDLGTKGGVRIPHIERKKSFQGKPLNESTSTCREIEFDECIIFKEVELDEISYSHTGFKPAFGHARCQSSATSRASHHQAQSSSKSCNSIETTSNGRPNYVTPFQGSRIKSRTACFPKQKVRRKSCPKRSPLLAGFAKQQEMRKVIVREAEKRESAGGNGSLKMNFRKSLTPRHSNKISKKVPNIRNFFPIRLDLNHSKCQQP